MQSNPVCRRRWRQHRARGHHPDRGPSSHGRGRQGCGNGHGHDDHSRGHGGRRSLARGGLRGRAHGDHPCEGSSRHVRDEVVGRNYGHGGGSARVEGGDHDRYRSRSAKTRMVECGPTDGETVSERSAFSVAKGRVPRSSECRRGQYACCASHGMRRQHHAGSHTQQRQSYQLVRIAR